MMCTESKEAQSFKIIWRELAKAYGADFNEAWHIAQEVEEEWGNYPLSAGTAHRIVDEIKQRTSGSLK